MMLILQILIPLMFIIENNHSLRCIHSYNPLKIKRKDLNYDLEITVNKLTTSEDTMCKVEIKHSYPLGDIEVRFARTFVPVDLNANVHLGLSTSITPSAGKSYTTVNILQFVCDDKDTCDRLFFFDHIKWLLNTTYDQLNVQIQPLLFLGTNPGITCLT